MTTVSVELNKNGNNGKVLSEAEQLKAMREMLAKLQAENDKLKAAKNKPLTIKLSEKGGLSVYGLGRFPVTLYKSQWLKLIGIVEDIKAFIDANGDKLKEKE